MNFVAANGNLSITLPEWVWAIIGVMLVLGVISLFTKRGRL